MSSSEEVEEYEEIEEESIGEGEAEAGEEIEEIGFTLDQINLMIQATEVWDQLLKGSTSLEEAKKVLDRGRGVVTSQQEKVLSTEKEEIEIEKKATTTRKRKKSRSKKSK